MEKLYNKIIAKFETDEVLNEFINAGITPPKYIDLYTGQDLKTGNFDLFTGNSLFMSWDIDHTLDPSIATVTFRLAFEQLLDTSNTSLNRELALNFFTYIQKVSEVLDGFESETTSKLKLIHEGFNKMDSIVDVYLLEYTCAYIGRNSQKNRLVGSFHNLQLSGQLVDKYDIL